MFLVAALGMLGFSLVSFPANLHSVGFALAIVTLVNDLLLVMIIMEVLRTVISYLQEHGTSLAAVPVRRRYFRYPAHSRDWRADECGGRDAVAG